MASNASIRCRLAACPETLGDDKQWSFYLINESDEPFDETVLCEASYEWGDCGNSEAPNTRVIDLAPGDHSLIWRCSDSAAELHLELTVRVRLHGRELLLNFDFGKLYLKNLTTVNGLGKPRVHALNPP